MFATVGVDAVSVDRIALAVSRSGPKFLNKVYTAAEQAYCAGNAERLAGRWAAKEAVIKCFDGTGICFPRRRIEVLPAPKGAPKVRPPREPAVRLTVSPSSGPPGTTVNNSAKFSTLQCVISARSYVYSVDARRRDATYWISRS